MPARDLIQAKQHIDRNFKRLPYLRAESADEIHIIKHLLDSVLDREHESQELVYVFAFNTKTCKVPYGIKWHLTVTEAYNLADYLANKYGLVNITPVYGEVKRKNLT